MRWHERLAKGESMRKDGKSPYLREQKGKPTMEEVQKSLDEARAHREAKEKKKQPGLFPL